MSIRKDPSTVRIRDILLEMRRYRMGLIQTADQLRFSYLAVIEGAKCIMGDTSLQVTQIVLQGTSCRYFWQADLMNRAPFLLKKEGPRYFLRKAFKCPYHSHYVYV